MKKLFLTSSTITPNLVEPFEKLIGKQIKGLKAVFIPDACYGVVPKKDLSWVQEEKQYLIDELDWEVKELELKSTKEVNIEDLKNMDVVFVNGGFSGYLAKEMRRTGFDDILPKLLEKGVVYVGSSAGSMVCSGYQFAAEMYIGEPEENASKINGLDLINFEIYPHYKEDMRNEIKSLYEGPELWLLKDGEAVVVDDKNIYVSGEKRVI